MRVWVEVLACLFIIATTQTHAQEQLASMRYRSVPFGLPDAAPGASERLHIGPLTLVLAYEQGSDSHAKVSIQRAGKTVYSTHINDLWNPNGWITLSPDKHSFALTWSDGGAIGGFHTRIFVANGIGVLEKSEGINAIQKVFSAQHNCAARGDNYSAVRWLTNSAVLIEASVYETGDCQQLGYTDRFILDVPHTKIVRRIHLADQP